MGYTLQGILVQHATAPPSRFRTVTVDLGHDVSLLPFTRVLLEQLSAPFLPLTDQGLKSLPGELVGVCAELSRGKRAAYVEAEIFGGTGMQAAVLYEDSTQSLPPIIAHDAINQALRFLGVRASRPFDEFDTVGLGVHRDTDEWSA